MRSATVMATVELTSHALDLALMRVLAVSLLPVDVAPPITCERLRILGYAALYPGTLGTPARWGLTAHGMGVLAWIEDRDPNLNTVTICPNCKQAHRFVLPFQCERVELADED